MSNATIKPVIFAAAMALFLSANGASEPDPVMRKALQTYQQGEYYQAAQMFEGLVKEGYVSAPLFFNLGNCYFQTGQLAKAVLNFERASLLQPGNEKIRKNLRLARNQVEGEPLAWPEFSPAVQWGSLRGMFTPNTWALSGLAACWLALAAWLLGRRSKKPLGWQLVTWILGFATLLSWLLAFSATRALESDYGIVMEKEQMLQVGPDIKSGTVSTIYEGWKVRRLDEIGDWIKVELPDGEEGWLKKETVEML